MKKILVTIMLAVSVFSITSIAKAAPVSWDGNVGTGILQPLQSLWGAGIKGSYFNATSTSATSTFAGDLYINGTTRIASSLSGFLKATSGVVSAVTSIVPADFSLTKGNFLVGDDAGVAQATSTIFISSTGSVGIGSTTPYGRLSVEGSSDQRQLVVKGNATQTSNLAEFQNSSGTNVFTISNTGLLNSRVNLTNSTIQHTNNNSSLVLGNVSIAESNSKDIVLTPFTSGKVGIGTSSPQSLLHVANGFSGGVPTDTTGLTIENSAGTSLNFQVPAANSAGIVWGSPGDPSAAQISYILNSDLMTIGTYNTGGDIAFVAGNGGEVVRILDTGNVGIGSTSPYAKLSIKGAGSTTGVNFQTTNSSNVPLITALDSGLVGIGTTAPSSILHINGGVGSLATGLTFGDGDTGFYENTDDTLYATFGGSITAWLTDTNWRSNTSRGWYLKTAGGTISAPTYSFAGDNNAGIYSPSNDNIRLAVGGEDVWVVDIDKDFGVGSSTPTYKLSVEGTSSLGNQAIAGYFTATTTATSTFAGGVQAMTGYFSGLLQLAGNVIANAGTILDFSSATVKQHTYPSVTWPGVATTTTATSTVPIGQAMNAQKFNFSTCRTTASTGGVRFGDGSSWMEYQPASTTASRYTFSTNNTFTTDENRVMEVGPLTNAQITCGLDTTVNN